MAVNKKLKAIQRRIALALGGGNGTRLRGFAQMKASDPERLRAIAQAAGEKAQKKHGVKIRWTAAQAKKMSRKGAKARWAK